MSSGFRAKDRVQEDDEKEDRVRQRPGAVLVSLGLLAFDVWVF